LPWFVTVARRTMPAIPGRRGSDGGYRPIFHVADARASVDWYAQLGFEVESEHAFGPDWPLYVRLRRGPAQLHLSEHRLDGGPASHVYLYVEDVDTSPPPGAAAEDCPWGMRETRLTDPDGNVVHIGSPLRKRNRQHKPDRRRKLGTSPPGAPAPGHEQRWRTRHLPRAPWDW